MCQQTLKVDFKLSEIVADRGFDGAGTIDWLDKHSITSRICPKSPQGLSDRLKYAEFSRLQTRRGSTESRIAILKNHTDGLVWRTKGLNHRRLTVGWSVLAHNHKYIIFWS